MKRINDFTGRLYLQFLVAENYPEQEPEYKLAKWYDLFWLLFPMVGFLFFIEKIKNRKYLKNFKKHLVD